MLGWLIEISVRFKYLLLALALTTITLGILAIRTIPSDVLPEFAPPYIRVQTEAPGLSSSEVEELVTFNLEELLNGTPWIQSIQSSSVTGLSSIVLYFEPGTDVMRARQLVNERLGLAYALPNVAQVPVILQPTSATGIVMMIGLTSKKVSAIDLSVLARWNIRPALLSVPGVANVSIWGQRDRQFQVQVQPSTLATNHVKLDQIISTAGNAVWVSPLSFLNASTPGSGGWIDTPLQRLEVRHVLPILTPKDLSIINIEDTTLNLGQVANVQINHPPLIGDDVVNNDSGLLIVIEKFPNANALQVTQDVEKELASIAPGLSGIRIDTSLFKPATFVELLNINTIVAFYIGLGLAFICLLFLLRSWRATLVCLIAIPACLASVVIGLFLYGMTLNVMVISGMVLGLIFIINTIVTTVATILQRLREAQNKTTAEIIFSTCFSSVISMLYAFLIILLALLPFLIFNSYNGAFWKPLSTSYLIAIAASIVAVMLFVPALSSVLLNYPIRYKQTLFTKIDNAVPLLVKQNSQSSFLLVSLMLMIIVSLVLATSLFYHRPAFLPNFQDPTLIIDCEGAPGTSLKEMKRITTLITHELSSLPSVTNTAVHLGRAVLGNQIVDVNSAEIIVNISPDERYKETVNKIQEILNSYPGLTLNLQTYLQQQTNLVRSGTTSNMAVRVYGSDLATLEAKGREVKDFLTHIPGVINVHPNQMIMQPQITIEVDLAKAQQVGLTPGDVRRAAATYIAGLEVGSLFQDQKIFPVVVWGDPATRNSIASINDLDIDLPDKANNSQKTIKLSQAAKVNITPSPNIIRHNSVSRYVDVTFDVEPGKLSSVKNQINSHLKNMSFPLEFRAELRGMGTTPQYTFFNYTLIIVGIIVAIFLILQAALQNFFLASLLLLTIPLALLGGIIFAIFFKNTSLAYFGFFIIFAISLQSSMLTIQQLNSTNQFSIQAFLTSIIICLLVLIPFAFSYYSPGLEILSPMAILVMVGLITVLLVNIIMVPVLYFRYVAKER